MRKPCAIRGSIAHYQLDKLSGKLRVHAQVPQPDRIKRVTDGDRLRHDWGSVSGSEAAHFSF